MNNKSPTEIEMRDMWVTTFLKEYVLNNPKLKILWQGELYKLPAVPFDVDERYSNLRPNITIFSVHGNIAEIDYDIGNITYRMKCNIRWMKTCYTKDMPSFFTLERTFGSEYLIDINPSYINEYIQNHEGEFVLGMIEYVIEDKKQ